ncbi:MAG TPA: hypothetical protein VFD32_21525, partial [Dehalococcoidia bacterium]|nr:hypothetical protein [Dehalococcoidia bacterium]
VLVAIRKDLSNLRRLATLIVGAGPVACVGLFYILFYFASDLASITHEGDMPTLYSTLTNWVFGCFLMIGLLFWVKRRLPRAVLVFFMVSTVQYGIMLEIAHHGVIARYVAHKLLYLLVFLASCLAAYGAAVVWSFVKAKWPSRLRMEWSIVGAAMAGLLLAPGVVRLPWPPPQTYSVDLYRTGVWTRAHLPPQCVDYITQVWQAEWWLHLAVLGNRRDTARTNAMYAEYGAPPQVRWRPAQLQPYVIVENVPAVPPDLIAGAKVLFQIGSDAVYQRAGDIPCTEAPLVRP